MGYNRLVETEQLSPAKTVKVAGLLEERLVLAALVDDSCRGYELS